MPVTATRTTTLQNDQDSDGFVDFGDVLRHTLQINVTGTPATGVQINDPLNGSTLTGTINVSPIAFDDTYTAVGNTLMVVGGTNLTGDPASVISTGNLLANDTDLFGDTFTITGNTAAANGTVTVSANGNFTYISNAGFEGTDTFTYTVTDSQGLTSTATASITVGGAAGQVWYVDPTYAGANGASDGTSLRPFTSLTELNGVTGDGTTGDDVDGTGDVIYVEGAGTNTGAIVLEGSQQLVGSGVELNVGGFSLAAAGSNSLVTAGNGTLVTLATGNTIAGVTLGNGGGTAGGITGTGFGTLTVNGAAIDVVGQAISLNNGTVAGPGFTFTNSDGGTNNVSLTSVNGTLNLGGGALTGASGVAFVVNGGTASVDYNGTITHTANARAIDMQNKTGGTIDFDGAVASTTSSDGVILNNNTGATINFDGGLVINTSASNATGFQATTGGTISVTGVNTITSGNGTALDLSGVTVGVTGVTFNSIATTGANGVLINSVGQAALSSGIDILGGTITNASTRGVDINATSADVTVNASISTTAAGRSVEVTGSGRNEAGGSQIIFSGAIDENGTGINLDNNDQNTFGATISFTGGLDIDSASGQLGFNATAGGTVNVTGGANSIVTTNNVGLNVANTNIGAGDLNFQSISVNGGTAGIVLNGTGTVGGLTITGDAGSAVNGSGGTIQNTTGGAALSFTDTRDISLDQMTVQNNLGDGILGSNVTNFSLTNSTVSNNGDALQEHGVDFSNVTGTVVFNTVTLSNNETSQVRFINTSGTVDAAFNAINASSTGLAAAPNGLHGLHFETQGNANGDLRVTNSQFNNFFSNSIHATNEGTGTLELTVASSQFTNTGASAINLAQNNSGTTRFWIHDNPVFTRGSNSGVSHVINVNQAGGTPAGAVLEGRINNNTIGNNTASDSASTGGYGVRVMSVGSGTTTTQIDNNNIQGAMGGIMVQMGEDTNPAHTMNATINNNTTFINHMNAFNSIYVNIGTLSGDLGIGRLDMYNNTATGGHNNNVGIAVYNRMGTTLQMPGYAGAFNSAAALETYLDVTRGNNASAPFVPWDIFADAAPGGFANTSPAGSAIPLPNLPSPLSVTPPPTGDPSGVPVVDTNNGSAGGPQGDLDGGTPGAGPVVVDDGVLSQAELDLLVDAAIDRWAAAGATAAQIAAMRATIVTVEDLAGLNVGVSQPGAIAIDHNAAGYSWFVDATPDDDSEFSGSGTLLTASGLTQAATRVDLLTTLMHELGHQIGLGDVYVPGEVDELMYGNITVGQRRLPGADDAGEATGTPVGGSALAIPTISLANIPAGRLVTVQWDSIVDSWGAGFVPTYANFATVTGLNPGAFSVNSNTETLSSGSAPLALDSLVLGGTVWADTGTGGGVRGDGQINGTEAGVNGVLVSLFIDDGDGVFDGGDVFVTTVTTAGGGVYTFTGLGPGDYIVRIDQDNFDAGGNVSLLGLQGSPDTTPEPIDPDNDVDGDDNGSRVAGQPAYSNAITLAYNTEPTADGTGQNDINTTLDFGFVAPNAPPTSTSINGDTATFTEGGGEVALDVGGNATIADGDSTDFDGGSLTVDITAGEVAAEDVLSIATVGTVTSDATTVSVGGVQIATWTGGTGGTPLVFTFDADATPATVQALVRALRYNNTGGEDPTDGDRTLTWTLVDGDGSAAGGNDTLTVTTTVDVDSVNDEPAGGDETIVVNEDDVHPFSASDFNFSDTDGDSLLEVVLVTLPANGALYLNNVAITLPMTVVSAADIGAGLLTFEPDANASGTGYASFTFQVRDNGGTDNGGQNTDQTPNTITIDVTALNDAPVNTAPGTQSINEDGSLTLSTLNGNALSVADVDAATLSVTLSVAHGALTLGTLTGLTFSTGDGTSDTTMTFSGTAADINAALGSGLFYSPDPDFNGTDTIAFSTSDGGETGIGGVGTDSDPITINIAPINDAPVVVGDGTESATTINEDTPGAGQSVSALFAGQYSDAADNQVPNGGASSSGAFSGVAVTSNGSSGATGQWQYFDGAVWTDIGAASDASAKLFSDTTLFRFTPALDFNGTAPTLTVHLVDNSLGFGIVDGMVVDASVTGNATPFSSGTVVLSQAVTAVNDAPVNTVGATVNATEGDIDIVLSTTGAEMSVSDVDAPGPIAYSLAVTAGILEIRTDVPGGITAANIQAIPGTGNGTGIINIAATISQINTTLAATNGLTYTPDTEFSGNVTLQVFANDGGQTGLDTNPVSILDPQADPDLGPLTEEDVDTRLIVIAAVEDPAVAQNDALSTLENAVLSGGAGALFSNNGSGVDVDVDGPPLQIELVNGIALNVGNQITLASGALLTVNADGSYSYDPNGEFDYLIDGPTAATTAALNTTATDSFTYTLVGGGTATVTITLGGVASVGDQLWGNSGDNTIMGTPGVDYFDLSQGGADVVLGNASNDAFYFGDAFTGADVVDGGAGDNDQIGLEGDYTGANALVLAAGTITNVEAIVVLPGYDYSITTHDGNVPLDGTLSIFAGNLGADDNFTFDGSLETDGAFRVFGGMGIDDITTGAGDDGIYFGPGKFNPLNDRVDGGTGDNDQLALDGDYLGLTLDGTAIQNIDAIVLLKGIVSDLAEYNLTLADSLTAAGQTITIWGCPVETAITVDGSGETDATSVLRMFGGTVNDTLIGGAGDDWFWGGLGGDTMTGGAGADTFFYEDVAQSGAAGFDTLVQFNDEVDKIDLDGITVTGFATAVANRLSLASFASDLQSGITALGAGQALLFTANAGDLVSRSFLVIDGNGTAGYQAAGDFVIELASFGSPIDNLGMFI